MHRRNKLAVVLAALAALTLSACGSGGDDAAGTASGNASSAASAESDTTRVTAESNKRIMERFTREFLPTGDAALAAEFISPDIVMPFAGQQQRGRDTYLDIVAANSSAFPNLKWTVDHMVAEGDTVAVRYAMTGSPGNLRRGPSDRQGRPRAEHGVLPPGRRQDRRGTRPARHAEPPSANGCRTGRIAARLEVSANTSAEATDVTPRRLPLHRSSREQDNTPWNRN